MLKNTILAATAAAAALLSTGAFAHGDHGRGHGWGHARYYAQPVPRRVVVVPAPRVVYAPPTRVAYPYYAAPVVVRPAPVYSAPSFSIRLNFPL
jgi:hypothetical protein